MKINPVHLLLLFRCTFTVTIALITYASLVNVTELPEIATRVWDKLQHASAFLLLSFLLQRSFPDKRPLSTAYMAQVVFLISYGALIEYLQSYSPYREASLGDLVADSVGVLCYTLLYLKNDAGQNSPREG